MEPKAKRRRKDEKVNTSRPDTKIKEKVPLPDHIRVGPTKQELLTHQGQPIEWKMRIQLPCGHKGGTWIMVLADKKSLFLKEVRSKTRPEIPLYFDNLKRLFGLPYVNLQWDPAGYLFCTDAGKGGPYPGAPATRRPDTLLVKSQVTPLQGYGSLLPDEAVAQLSKLLLFRGLFSITDTHYRNFFWTQEGGVQSVDENCFAPERWPTDCSVTETQLNSTPDSSSATRQLQLGKLAKLIFARTPHLRHKSYSQVLKYWETHPSICSTSLISWGKHIQSAVLPKFLEPHREKVRRVSLHLTNYF